MSATQADSKLKRSPYWSIVHHKGETPSPRIEIASWSNNNLLFVFGGMPRLLAPLTNGSELYTYDLKTHLWKSRRQQGGGWPNGWEGASTWTTSNHIGWMFGGAGIHGNTSNLYMIDLQKQVWHFVGSGKGHGKTLLNWPQPRSLAGGWSGPNQKLYMYGGVSNKFEQIDGQVRVTSLHNLWIYSTKKEQWKRITGPAQESHGSIGKTLRSNWPGAISFQQTWVGNHGNLWMYSGATSPNFGPSSGDLWKYDVQLSEWVYEGPDKNQKPNEKGACHIGNPSSGCWPMKVMGAATWTGKDGSLWMLGGTVNGSPYPNSALWEYQPKIREWTYWGDKKRHLSTGAWPKDLVTAWKLSNGRVYAYDGYHHLYLFHFPTH